ncbi:MAG TPA: sigma-70 family RNA polymerase sigma factor [Polyangiaceae bacterium]|nr:sigma-70 family RNA polymerase sigma factor [Polyangiaceae bacterium]
MREKAEASRHCTHLHALALRARRGDARAARELVTELAPSLLGVVRSVLGASHPDVEDVLQEALVGFLGALGNFRGECGIKHFGCRIAARSALDARRRAWRARRREEALRAERSEELAASAHEEATAQRRCELVRRLLDELPEVQAETLALRLMLGFSMQEVADATGAPVNTVRSRLRLAKEALAKRIDGDPILCEELEVAG